MSEQKSQARKISVAGLSEGKILDQYSICNHRQTFDRALSDYTKIFLNFVDNNLHYISREVAFNYYKEQVKSEAKKRKFDFEYGNVNSGISILCFSYIKMKKVLLALENHLARKAGAM